MALSEIRVNTTKTRTGVGTITYTETGPVITGIATASNFKTGSTNVHSTGVELANINTGGSTATFGGPISGTNATFSGTVSIGGTLTYEDVTNIDSVGLITARNGISVSAGDLVVGAASYNTTGSFGARSNGEFRSVLPQNTASSTMLGAIGGASNGFNIVIDSSNNQTYKFFNGSAQAVTITDNGRIYIGHASSGTYDGIQPQVQLEGTNYNTSSMSLFCNSNTVNNAPQLQLGKSRSGSDGGTTALQNGDRVGSIYGIAADGSDRNSSVGSIQFYVDGSVSTDQTPGSIRFATTASNGSTPTERLRIDSTGRLLVKGAAATNAFNGGDDLIIGNTSSGTRTGMTLVSASNTDSGVYFSRGTSSNSDYVRGQLVYNHPNEYFAIYTGATGIRLKINQYGGHNIYNDNTYNAANLAECDADNVALNIRKTRNVQTKGIAIGAIGGSSGTGIQAYDSSDDSANELALNPFGGALLVGLTSPTYSGGDMQHEIKKDNSRTYTAPLMVAHSHLLLNNSDTTNGAFCGLGIRAGNGDGTIGFHFRGATNHADFVIATDSGANGVEGFRIKSQTRTCSIGDNVDPLNALHILDKTTSTWDSALTAGRAALRVETHWDAQGQRAVGDYGSGIVFNHLAGHSASHNNDSHAWLGLRVHDTPGYERSALVFATNDITGSESGHDTGLKERMQINPHGQVAIDYTGTMTSTSHAKLWVEENGINLATEWDPGDNQGSKPHLTLAGKNSHVRLDMGTMDVGPWAGYIQARFDNTPDLGATDNNDGLEPLMIQPKGGATAFNFGHSTTMPGNFDGDSPYGIIRMRAGRAASATINDDTMAVKIWPAEQRVYTNQIGEQDQGTKYGGIGWLVLDGQSNGGWASYDGTQCWQGMSLHSTPGQELANWQLRMNSSGNANSQANNIALQANPNGYVTKPNLPAFNVGSPYTSGGSSGSVWRCHANSLWLNRGNHYDNSNGRFTAPINGLYYFYFWGMSTSGHNATMDIYSRLEGSRDQIGTAYESNGGSSGGYHQFTAQFIRELTKGQYVDIYTSNGSVYSTTDGRHGGWGGWLIG